MTDEERKPCGEYHPLPCGLDEACPVPVEYHDVELTNEQIVNRSELAEKMWETEDMDAADLAELEDADDE